MTETEKLCGICNLPIVNGRSNQLFHADKCAGIAHNKRCTARSRKKWLTVSPFVDKICLICNKPYRTRAARPALTCSDRSCKNKQQRIRMKAAWDKKTPEERHQIGKARYDRYAKGERDRSLATYYTTKNPTETRECICPGCGEPHMHTFSPAWIGRGTPRIKCERWPHCANGPAFRDGRTTEQRYDSTYGTNWENENGCSI